ncbi:MAG TPA: nucleotide sugar dehydrogenase [Gammaproteobacteria bacterium]|nr:nucleotide sugar dehydrogenase [Gammaproteobacteria bacterium]
MTVVNEVSCLESSLCAIRDKEATIAVIGLGYVGIPLLLNLHEKGFKCVGYDVDIRKIEALRSGCSYIKSFSDEQIKSLQKGADFQCSQDPSILNQADAILICVPTPLNKNREPDMSYVEQTAITIADNIRRGQLIVLESTTYPGTTSELIKPILEKTGLCVGDSLFLAYSPEREDPGNKEFSTQRIPKVVGADDEGSLNLAVTLYEFLVPEVIKVKDAKTAEAVKLTENIFRSVNIALVNELKVVYSKMGIDVWEVIDAAKSKPFGFMPFYPGPGLGGHCIPIDPFYLTWKAREYGVTPRFIELSGQVNGVMPDYVIHCSQMALSDYSTKAVKGSKLLLLGLSYKKNVDDVRESPSLVIMERLISMGANVDYHDPYIETIEPMREHPDLVGLSSIAWSKETLSGYDMAIICTDHDCINYQELVDCLPIIVDTRNATKGISSDRIVKA